MIAVFSIRSFEVSTGKFGGTIVISGSLHRTLLQEKTHKNMIKYNGVSKRSNIEGVKKDSAVIRLGNA